MRHIFTLGSTPCTPFRAGLSFLRLAGGVLLAGIAAASGFAQGSTTALSKDKLAALRTAGLSDSVLIQQIEKDGISFDMTADTTLELKGSGFSNDVLQALASCQQTGVICGSAGRASRLRRRSVSRRTIPRTRRPPEDHS